MRGEQELSQRIKIILGPIVYSSLPFSPLLAEALLSTLTEQILREVRKGNADDKRNVARVREVIHSPD